MDRFPSMGSCSGSSGLASGSSKSSYPGITPMLFGIPRMDSDLESWFATIKKWGVRKWMAFTTADRPKYGSCGGGPQAKATTILADAWPGFKTRVQTKIRS